MKKHYLILLIIFVSCFLIFWGYINLKPSMKTASFANLEPSVVFENRKYLINKEVIVAKEDIGEQIAKITQVSLLISYSDDNNPYKNPGKICKVNGELPEKKLAVEINNCFYIAEFIKNVNTSDAPTSQK